MSPGLVGLSLAKLTVEFRASASEGALLWRCGDQEGHPRRGRRR